MAAALAVADCICDLCEKPVAPKLKWPNDVVTDGGKLSGILLESQRVQGNDALVVGIGINLSPVCLEDTSRGAGLAPMSIAELNNDVAPSQESAMDAISTRLEFWLDLLDRDGFEPIRSAWLDRAYGLGERMTARLSDRSLEGIFAGLDEMGALQLKQRDGLISIPAADVFFMHENSNK